LQQAQGARLGRFVQLAGANEPHEKTSDSPGRNKVQTGLVVGAQFNQDHVIVMDATGQRISERNRIIGTVLLYEELSQFLIRTGILWTSKLAQPNHSFAHFRELGFGFSTRAGVCYEQQCMGSSETRLNRQLQGNNVKSKKQFVPTGKREKTLGHVELRKLGPLSQPLRGKSEICVSVCCWLFVSAMMRRSHCRRNKIGAW
jgi:hypothetical protein